MLDQVLRVFKIRPHFDLNLMQSGQTLEDLTSRVLLGLRDVLSKEKPDLVLVHGDTTTSFAASLAAFYQKIAVGHVEAGLRSGDIYAPWPEEANRRLTSKLTRCHFAPTQQARLNLLGEGVAPDDVIVTGNTVIDALFWTQNQLLTDINLKSEVEREFLEAFDNRIERMEEALSKDRRLILITCHRRENFGSGIENISRAIAILAKKYSEFAFVYPVSPQPKYLATR